MKVTLDTNTRPADDLLAAGTDLRWEFAVISVTEREVEDSDIQVTLAPLGKVAETGVWGESTWDSFVWGSESTAAGLQQILAIIGHGSFPLSRDSLSDGQRRQLRDAMIFQAHIREQRDIFVTKDIRAFVSDGRREELQGRFHTRIVTPEEFLALCDEQQPSD